MAIRKANLWAQWGAGLTALCHQRAPAVRWGIVLALAATWMWAGYTGWVEAGPGAGETVNGPEALYRTLGALAPDESYRAPPNWRLEVARFAGVAVPLIGLLFAFSTQLGRSVAQLLNKGARGHIVIAGASPQALALADDCVAKGDVVMMIAPEVMEETAHALRAKGITLLAGDAARVESLRQARAHRAAHVVAMDDNDTRNLHIEAAVRSLVAARRAAPGLPVHTAMTSPLLLMEAREMRNREQKAHEKKHAGKKRLPRPPLDAKPFSMSEIAARALLQAEAPKWLTLADQLKQDRIHLVLFGFSQVGEALAVRLLTVLWSMRFQPSRVTVVTPDPRQAEMAFRARYPQAFSHPDLWTPDIVFQHYDWRLAAVDQPLLQEIAASRGPATLAAVCTGEDDENIRLALALLRACNLARAWPVPIYLHEVSGSEFSRQYAAGDKTPELDAYLQAFGARETLATRAILLDAALDRGAAIAHEYYVSGIAARGEMSMADLQAAAKSWTQVLESYRAANRGSADSALIKLWDAGWTPAGRGEPGEQNPKIPEDLKMPLARREHDRWMAERLFAGWRAGVRDNDLMVHNNLTAWDNLTAAEKDRDVDQVESAVKVARLQARRGFVRRS